MNDPEIKGVLQTYVCNFTYDVDCTIEDAPHTATMHPGMVPRRGDNVVFETPGGASHVMVVSDVTWRLHHYSASEWSSNRDGTIAAVILNLRKFEGSPSEGFTMVLTPKVELALRELLEP